MSRSSRTPIYYSPAYTAAAHAFDTTRKATWIAESLAAQPIESIEIVAPASLTEAQLLAVHDAVYVQAVKTGMPRRLAESNGFSWDSGIWDAVRASNGGAVAAVLDALTSRRNAGSLSSGLHHASARSGAGFRTSTGLALAAPAALNAGAARILILGLDAHMGDGTIRIVRDWPGVVHCDITVCPWSAPFASARATLDVISDATDYLPTLARRLAALVMRRSTSVSTTLVWICMSTADADGSRDDDRPAARPRGAGVRVVRATVRCRSRSCWPAATRQMS